MRILQVILALFLALGQLSGAADAQDKGYRFLVNMMVQRGALGGRPPKVPSAYLVLETFHTTKRDESLWLVRPYVLVEPHKENDQRWAYIPHRGGVYRLDSTTQRRGAGAWKVTGTQDSHSCDPFEMRIVGLKEEHHSHARVTVKRAQLTHIKKGSNHRLNLDKHLAPADFALYVGTDEVDATFQWHDHQGSISQHILVAVVNPPDSEEHETLPALSERCETPDTGEAAEASSPAPGLGWTYQLEEGTQHCRVQLFWSDREAGPWNSGPEFQLVDGRSSTDAKNLPTDRAIYLKAVLRDQSNPDQGPTPALLSLGNGTKAQQIFIPCPTAHRKIQVHLGFRPLAVHVKTADGEPVPNARINLVIEHGKSNYEVFARSSGGTGVAPFLIPIGNSGPMKILAIATVDGLLDPIIERVVAPKPQTEWTHARLDLVVEDSALLESGAPELDIEPVDRGSTLHFEIYDEVTTGFLSGASVSLDGPTGTFD